MRKKKRGMTNPLKWLGWLFSPIAKNGAFFVFMFVLGWLCCQLEIMPYYLRNRGAQPYKLTVPELFLDLYMVCVVLTFLRTLTARLPSFVFRLFLFILYFLLYSPLFYESVLQMQAHPFFHRIYYQIAKMEHILLLFFLYSVH